MYSDDDGKTITLGATGCDYSDFLQCLNGKSQVTLQALHILFTMDFIDLIPLDVLSMGHPKGFRAQSLQGILCLALGSQRQNCHAPGLHCFLFKAPRAPSLNIHENNHGTCLGSRAPLIPSSCCISLY